MIENTKKKKNVIRKEQNTKLRFLARAFKKNKDGLSRAQIRGKIDVAAKGKRSRYSN